jgi:hypothetical protein
MKRFWFSSSEECSNNNKMDCPNFVNFEPREKPNVSQTTYILTNQEHGDAHRNNIDITILKDFEIVLLTLTLELGDDAWIFDSRTSTHVIGNLRLIGEIK